MPLHEWKENQNGQILSNSTVGDDGIITWVFEENSFIPTAKLKGDKKYSILADHLGTPTHMYDGGGALTWERELDINGRAKHGGSGSCPFLFQGQYYDPEIELAYNRHRYYDPNDGRYISKDPIGLLSGEYGLYNYVDDPNGWVDVFGLSKTYNNNTSKKDLPVVDHTGKLHGELPTRQEWSMHSREDLMALSQDLERSIRRRSHVNSTHPDTDKLPSHSRRLNDEIDLKREIDNYLSGT